MADRIVKIILRGDVAGLKASMTAASKSVQDAADKMTGASKESKKFREGLTAVGDTAGKIGLVAAAGLGAVVAASANFDKAMSNVKAATHESTQNMHLLREAAIKAGADTAFSASEAAAGIENLAKAGVSTKDILAGGLSGALDLAAAGGMEVADAAETAATALTQFGLKGADVPHVADLLAAGAGKAQGEVSDLGMALNQSGLVAAQMGLSIEETTGSLAAFASAGLLGSDAGTSLKTMLLRLANPSSEAAGLMKQFGINAYDASGNMVSMADLAGQLQGAFKNQSQATRDAALATIFGSDAIRAANVLYSQGADGITEWTNKVNDQGYAAETAATKLDNLAGDLEAFKGSLETALIGSGEGAQGPLRGLVQGATEAVNAFSALPGPVKSTGTALLGITAVTGGGLWFTSKAIAGVASMRANLALLGITAETTRAKLALVSTGGAAAALGVAAFTDAITQMDSWKRSRDAADATAKSFQDLADALSYSNVGKYADDLHIDINRLADDLVTNGEKGEYASRVMDRLTESSHGFGALLNAELGHATLGQFGGDAEKASAAHKDLGVILENNTGILGSGASATEKAADAVGDLGDVAGSTGIEVQNLSDRLNGLIDGPLSRDEALVAWKRSIQGLTKDLKGGSNALDVNTKKGQDNRDAIRERVHALQASIQKDAEAGVGQERLAAKLRTGRKAILDAGAAAGVSKGQMNAYLDELKLTPKNLRTIIKLEKAAAQAALDVFSRAFYGLDGKVARTHVQVTTDHIENRLNKATGGYISGPGTATSDSIPAYLSNGEYVIKAAAVAKYGVHMFDRLNAMRFAEGGHVRRFASGGSVSSANPDVAGFDKALKAVTKSLDDQKAALDDAKSALKDLRQTAKDFGAAVAANFKSDVFSGDSPDALAEMPDDVRRLHMATMMQNQLQHDISQAQAFKRVLHKLRAEGLRGEAFKELAASGDLERAQALASLSKSEVRQFNSLYAQRTQAANAVGNYASSAAYSKAIAAQTAEVRELRREVAKLTDEKHGMVMREKSRKALAKDTGDAVGHAVNGAAAGAARRRK